MDKLVSVCASACVRASVYIILLTCGALVSIQARIYGHLFTTEEPEDAVWEQELNPDSEVVLDAKVTDWAHPHAAPPTPFTPFQIPP